MAGIGVDEVTQHPARRRLVEILRIGLHPGDETGHRVPLGGCRGGQADFALALARPHRLEEMEVEHRLGVARAEAGRCNVIRIVVAHRAGGGEVAQGVDVEGVDGAAGRGRHHRHHAIGGHRRSGHRRSRRRGRSVLRIGGPGAAERREAGHQCKSSKSASAHVTISSTSSSGPEAPPRRTLAGAVFPCPRSYLRAGGGIRHVSMTVR